MAIATKSARRPATKATQVFSAEERDAMKAAVADRKRGKVTRADGEAELLAAIAKLGEPDRTMAERIHAIVTAAAPDLWPRTWYGMPAYAMDDKIICHFQPAAKFKMRYATLGFSDKAKLDDGNMWPNAFALAQLTPDVEARIAALVKQAVG
jgi:uncharacterized protein YdhG (YjbR/CyaY superfamily)